MREEHRPYLWGASHKRERLLHPGPPHLVRPLEDLKVPSARGEIRPRAPSLPQTPGAAFWQLEGRVRWRVIEGGERSTIEVFSGSPSSVVLVLGVVFGLAQGGRREEVLRGCGWDAYSYGAPHGGLRGPPLHLSHPREGTGAVLFLGQVTSPSAEKTELLLAKICRNWIRWSEVPGTGSPRHDLLTATVEFRNDHPFPVEGT